MAEKPNKAYSSKQEKLIANELGGYPVGLSGAGAANPGDVKTYDWLVECKTHTKSDQSILFDLDVWKKIQNEATGIHRKPVLIVDDGSQTIDKTWCLCKASNLNMSGAIAVDLPMSIRKNITCKHDKLINGLKEISRTNIIQRDTFYSSSYVIYEVNWGGHDVAIMPFATFKELIEK